MYMYTFYLTHNQLTCNAFPTMFLRIASKTIYDPCSGISNAVRVLQLVATKNSSGPFPTACYLMFNVSISEFLYEGLNFTSLLYQDKLRAKSLCLFPTMVS